MEYLIRGSERLAAHSDFRLVGRDAELDRLVAILMREHASSVVLTGPGGVGCTSLILGIQAAKTLPGVAFDVLRKRLFWLDVDDLFGLGDPERVNHAFHRLIARLEVVDNSVLVVEDARDLIEACRNAGAMHFINALLAAVRRGRTQMILEADETDLDAVMRVHSDLREVFTVLPLEEPTGDALRSIVGAAAGTLLRHHGIAVGDDALATAIDVTTRYAAAASRAQPERAITLLDRALAAYRLDAHALVSPGDRVEIARLNDLQRTGEREVARLEDEREVLRARERELQPGPDDARTSVFQRIAGGFESPEVAALSRKITGLNGEIVELATQVGGLTARINAGLALDRGAVLREFSRISGISLSRLDQDEVAKLRALDETLRRRIFGQDEAVRRVSDGVRVMKVGRRTGGRPLPFLFLGPSGVGKTEIAKALAAALLDDEAALTRFDMSEYMEKHAVAKLIGAPPGYEGFEAGGVLTNLMRRSSNRVLLFDEIEKAHPDVFNIFLQVLSDGRLTDNIGRTVSFDGTVLLMTTNIGQPHFLDETLGEADAEAAALVDLAATYRSEFLNRFAGRQNIVCFKKLDHAAIEKIVWRELGSLDAAYGERGLRVEADEGTVTGFVRDQYDPRIGARGLPGFISANLEPILVNALIEDHLGTARVGYERAERRFTVGITR